MLGARRRRRLWVGVGLLGIYFQTCIRIFWKKITRTVPCRAAPSLSSKPTSPTSPTPPTPTRVGRECPPTRRPPVVRTPHASRRPAHTGTPSLPDGNGLRDAAPGRQGTIVPESEAVLPGRQGTTLAVFPPRGGVRPRPAIRGARGRPLVSPRAAATAPCHIRIIRIIRINRMHRSV